MSGSCHSTSWRGSRVTQVIPMEIPVSPVVSMLTTTGTIRSTSMAGEGRGGGGGLEPTWAVLPGKNFNGCPTLVRTDRGTENGITATIQCFLRRNHHDSLAGINAHRYGSSHTNQRIEGWWSFLRKSWSTWWINFFKDMVYKGDLDTSNPIQTECLWFSFNKIIQRELDEVKDEWNDEYFPDQSKQLERVVFFITEICPVNGISNFR